MKDKRIVWTPVSINGTSFSGTFIDVPDFTAAVARLARISGQDPTELGCDKVTACFRGTYGGEVFTLYDYYGDARLHIGSRNFDGGKLAVKGLKAAVEALLAVPPETLISGKPAPWDDAILAKWDAASGTRPPGRVSYANYFTPRPYVDEYNRGSHDEGFTYTIEREVFQVVLPKVQAL